MVRKVLLAIVGVVIVCAGALWAAATYFLDNATIAEQLKKEVSERFNRTLVFQGELETNFFPKIELVLPAKRMLVYSAKSIKEISVELGIEDYAYFTRLFTKAVGINPSAYRKNYLE